MNSILSNEEFDANLTILREELLAWAGVQLHNPELRDLIWTLSHSESALRALQANVASSTASHAEGMAQLLDY